MNRIVQKQDGWDDAMETGILQIVRSQPYELCLKV